MMWFLAHFFLSFFFYSDKFWFKQRGWPLVAVRPPCSLSCRLGTTTLSLSIAELPPHIVSLSEFGEYDHLR